MYSTQFILKYLHNINYAGSTLEKSNKIKDILIKENSATIIIDAVGLTSDSMQNLERLCKSALAHITDLDVKIIFAQDASQKFRVPNVKNIIVVASGKGGVGKSTIAAHLALLLTSHGFRTGLLDADVYGPSIPCLFNINQKPDLSDDGKMLPIMQYGVNIISMGFLVDSDKPIIWRGPMLSKALAQLMQGVDWRHDGQALDFLIIDTPPGTGDVHLTLATKYEIDGAVFVSTPQKLAVIDTVKSINMFKELKIPIIGIVENMNCFVAANGEEHTVFGDGDMMSQQCAALNIPIIAKIPLNNLISYQTDVNLNVKVVEEYFASLIEQLKSFNARKEF